MLFLLGFDLKIVFSGGRNKNLVGGIFLGGGGGRVNEQIIGWCGGGGGGGALPHPPSRENSALPLGELSLLPNFQKGMAG